MSSDRQAPKESGPKVPAYIVTFSDMVTLLLTFFVMLLSLAEVKDDAMFYKSRDAFVSSISSFGLGLLFGGELFSDFGAWKPRYITSGQDEPSPTRIIDNNEDRKQQLFNKIAQTMTTRTSQIVSENTNFTVTNIVFSPNEASLNEPAKNFLRQFAIDLQQENSLEKVKLYILGLANEEKNEKKQWILSAKRAQAVADFLSGILPMHFQCPIYSWGAGSGGEWVTDDSPVSEQSQILIAVLRSSD